MPFLQGRRHGFLSGGDEALWIQQDFCPMMGPRNLAFSIFSGFDPLYFGCSRFVLFVLRTSFHCAHSGISSKPRTSWVTWNLTTHHVLISFFSVSGWIGVTKILWFFKRTTMSTHLKCKWGRFGLAHFRFVCLNIYIEHKYQSSQNTCTEAGTRQLVYAGRKKRTYNPQNLFTTETVGVIYFTILATHTPTVLTMCVNDRVMPDFYPSCLVVFN